ncbi:hypothetical protein L484_002532 [Morus notabilis]|uniref:Uncharacterized protein n=1 Tax=Morus notabilis TaxID=981085 RepID=W9RJN9_9ROSA|nr:hypothetical protein L484_002532 [Morus notabilis]
MSISNDWDPASGSVPPQVLFGGHKRFLWEFGPLTISTCQSSKGGGIAIIAKPLRSERSYESPLKPEAHVFGFDID